MSKILKNLYKVFLRLTVIINKSKFFKKIFLVFRDKKKHFRSMEEIFQKIYPPLPMNHHLFLYLIS
jgi:hypothetical protein